MKGHARSMTDGDELIGWGVATATYPTQMAPCAVRVSLDTTEARVQVASHDLGTGAYTVLAQAVHNKLGVPVERASGDQFTRSTTPE